MYPADELAFVDRSKYVAGTLQSSDPDLLFIFSCNAHWRVAEGIEFEPAGDHIASQVLEQIRPLARLVCVGSPDNLKHLLAESAPNGISADLPGVHEARIAVSDVQVRVEGSTQERWKKVSDWRQRMDIKRVEKSHLEGEVWKGVPEVLLWHLASNPDPAKAASVIGPAEKVLRALGVPVDIPHVADEASVGPGPGTSPAVHLVRSRFPEDTGERDLFAVSLALLLERSGDKESAALLRTTFTASSGDADAEAS
jgi:hypothetical protein